MHKVTKTLSKKFISILLLFGILSSCSIIGDWWYKQLDNYLANYFFQYADFSSVQKEFISNTTKKFHRWHMSDADKHLIVSFSGFRQYAYASRHRSPTSFHLYINNNIFPGGCQAQRTIFLEVFPLC